MLIIGFSDFLRTCRNPGLWSEWTLDLYKYKFKYTIHTVYPIKHTFLIYIHI